MMTNDSHSSKRKVIVDFGSGWYGTIMNSSLKCGVREAWLDLIVNSRLFILVQRERESIVLIWGGNSIALAGVQQMLKNVRYFRSENAKRVRKQLAAKQKAVWN